MELSQRTNINGNFWTSGLANIANIASSVGGIFTSQAQANAAASNLQAQALQNQQAQTLLQQQQQQQQQQLEQQKLALAEEKQQQEQQQKTILTYIAGGLGLTIVISVLYAVFKRNN